MLKFLSSNDSFSTSMQKDEAVQAFTVNIFTQNNLNDFILYLLN